MKISLITSTYNSGQTLRDTIESVRSQSYSQIEYLIIDGDSTDNTLDLIKENLDIVSNFSSEKDAGIYDALNKGISMSTGDVIGILHSDDVLAYPEVLEDVAKALTASNIDACYGDLNYVDRADLSRTIRTWKSREFDRNLFYSGWMPAHPTFFLRAKHFDTLGSYDLSFFTAADYELMLRMLFKNRLKAVYIPKVMVNMRVGGQSNVTWKNRWIANQEDARAWVANGMDAKWYTRWLKPISKIGQFFG